ncbi:nephrin-like [Oppia nitens]|uniref:nephrin-like n=1 Tax=Oppia nitens TaxID=1686743 RepID=UPI0023DBB9E8|nr:nephrin-like [Oppia nitens]
MAGLIDIIPIHITQSVTVYNDVQTSLGDRAQLPCNVTAPSDDDSVTLVLWYRSDVKILPIYTVDIRHNREKAKHLTHEVLADRAFFNLTVRPAILQLYPILETDSAEYRCRVDFRWGRTLTSIVNLNVIVPPKRIYITDARNQQLSRLVGPVEEGSDVRLNCIVEGGKPSPIVHWYRDNVLIDSTSSTITTTLIVADDGTNDSSSSSSSSATTGITSSSTTTLLASSSSSSSSVSSSSSSTTTTSISRVKNELLIEDIRRNQLNSIYSCNAINNNIFNNNNNISQQQTSLPALSSPSSLSTLSAFVTFDIYVKPTDVKIISIRRPLSSGKKFELICRSYGSRPPAQLTWLKDNRLLSKTRETFSDEGNVTTSVLEFTPSAEDHGSYLNCRAENLRLANSSIQDQWLLSIFFQPKVNLTMKTNSPNGLVVEGSQLSMECLISANPSVVEVKWLFNGTPLKQDIQKDLYIRNASLEIRSVSREDEGLYQCSASNLEGKSDSNDIRLRIHFAPICKQNRWNNSIGAAIGDTIELVCMVEASPASVTFDWTVNRLAIDNNNHNNNNDDNHMQKHSDQHLTSRLLYTVNNRDSYGIIECTAKNIVGRQRQACHFNIIAAGPPESVIDCRVSNITEASFLVECLAGYDGGLNQTYHLDIYDDSELKRLVKKLSNKLKPIFLVEGLRSGHIFFMNIYSVNSRGKSTDQTITSNTLTSLSSLSSDAKQQEEWQPFYMDLNPLLGATVVLVLATILVAFILVLICKINRRRHRRHRNRERHKNSGSDSNCSPKFTDTDFRSKVNSNNNNNNKNTNTGTNTMIDDKSLFNDYCDTKSPDILQPAIEFTELGHSSQVLQCLAMDWTELSSNTTGGVGGSATLVDCLGYTTNGSIPGINLINNNN